MNYRVAVFDRRGHVVFTELVTAADPVDADAQGYGICYQSTTGCRYEVEEVKGERLVSAAPS